MRQKLTMVMIEGKDGGDKASSCPFSGTIPKMAPFRPSKMSSSAGKNQHSLEHPEDFVRPDYPSRCTWTPGADRASAPHTFHERYDSIGPGSIYGTYELPIYIRSFPQETETVHLA